MLDLFGTVPKYETDALSYLIIFAHKNRGRAFSPEEVTLGAMNKGIAFADLRAWGGVFATAARDGYIRRSVELFPRAMSNGSLRPGWVGC